ncbi:hypothetical protein GCM10025784_29790 [Citricoccus nitrophenolicus]
MVPFLVPFGGAFGHDSLVGYLAFLLLLFEPNLHSLPRVLGPCLFCSGLLPQFSAPGRGVFDRYSG